MIILLRRLGICAWLTMVFGSANCCYFSANDVVTNRVRPTEAVCFQLPGCSQRFFQLHAIFLCTRRSTFFVSN